MKWKVEFSTSAEWIVEQIGPEGSIMPKITSPITTKQNHCIQQIDFKKQPWLIKMFPFTITITFNFSSYLKLCRRADQTFKW